MDFVSEDRILRPKSWIVVNTHPSKERLAEDHLQRQEFTVYCPVVKRRIRHARKVHDTLRPMFPSYMFVSVEPKLQRWRSILSTIGVRSVVRCGDDPSLIDDDFIRALKAREVDGAIVKPAQAFVVGQQVRLSTGAFDGVVATIIELNEKDRLTLLMQLLNQTVRVKVDGSSVTAV